MKHIGIIGVSAEGAALCYKTICSEAAKLLGGHRHPEITMHEFSSQLYFEAQPDWNKVGALLYESIRKVASAGADFAIIPSNTMHYAYSIISKLSPIPIINILEETAKECQLRKFSNVAILGTRATMEGGLYQSDLERKGISILIPSSEDQSIIEHVIFNEITPSLTTLKTSEKVIEVINHLKVQGADGVILGCTELPILINESNSPLPAVDTTRLLAQKALAYAICGE